MHRRSFLQTLATTSAGLILPIHAAPKSSATVPVEFLTPNSKGYAAAREVFNSTILTRPPLIARCSSEAGVVQAVTRAVEEKMPLAIKSGGHSFEGFCLSRDGLTVELARMKSMKLDAKTGILTAGPGCKLADVNNWLLAKSRLLPSGSCATVGISGLTLGGGYGLFSRKFGLTCDHLTSIRMVDANGKVHDSRDDTELLWACRGGGNGHFGVVTELSLRTQPAPKGLAAFKLRASRLNEARAISLLKTWFEISPSLPNEAFSAFVLNGNFLTILVTTVGSIENKGLKKFLGVMEGAMDQATTAKAVPLPQALPRYYGQKGPLAFKNASAGYYKEFADLAPSMPGIINELFSTGGLVFQVNTLGGAINDGPDSAYPHRAYPFLGEWQAYWDHASRRDVCTAAAGRMRDVLAKNGITRHYANYPDCAFTEWPTAYYGTKNYQRLQAVKRKFDPNNRFQHAQSVKG